MNDDAQADRYAYPHNIDNAEAKRFIRTREVISSAENMIDLYLRVIADLFRTRAYLSDEAIARLNAVADTARFLISDNPDLPHPILDNPEILSFIGEMISNEYKPSAPETHEVNPWRPDRKSPSSSNNGSS